jgi:copper transport protein
VKALGRALAVLGGGLALVVALAGPALAHASLVAVDPADGARLDEAPSAVRLTFSEPVSVDLGGVRVLDADGEDVHEGAARVDGDVVELALADDLPEGTYVVSFRVVSADGHPVRGGSVFGVGDVEVDRGALGRVAGGSDRSWEVVGAVGRAVAYAGVFVAAGGVAFLVLVHRGRAALLLVRVVRGAAALGGVASVVALPVQAALGTGQGPWSLLDDGVLGEVAADGVGLGVVLALAGLTVAAVAVVRAPWLSLAGAAVAAGSFAAAGHTRAGSDLALATVADVAHLWVAAVWVGGVVLLVLVLRSDRAEPTPPATEATVGVVGRFSTLATGSIVLAGLTGTVLAWREVGSVDALAGTGYGRLLLAKVLLVAWVAVLGAYNHLRLVPALGRGKATAALTQLWTTLRLEAVVLAVVVAVAAVLVVVTPGRTEAEPGVVERIVPLGDAGSIQLTVAPARTGSNQVHLYLFDPDGRPAEIAESVTVVLTLPAAQLGPITREAVRAGPAHLQLDTDDLAIAGTWTVELRALVDRFTEATGTAEVPIAG